MMSLLKMLPQCFKGSAETVALIECIQIEINKLNAEYKKFYDELYAQSCEKSIEKWEKMCGLPSIQSLSLDERRRAVILLLRGSGTCTAQKIRDLASSYDFEDIDVVEYVGTYTVKIRFMTETLVWFTPDSVYLARDKLQKAIREIVPAHLSILFKYQPYRKWGEFSRLKWGEISEFTWNEVRRMEVIPT